MLEHEDLDAHLVQAAHDQNKPKTPPKRGFDEKLHDMISRIDKDKLAKESNVYTMWGVDKCKAPKGCESIQYGCRAWKCEYDGSKDRWPNDASSHYSRKR